MDSLNLQKSAQSVDDLKARYSSGGE